MIRLLNLSKLHAQHQGRYADILNDIVSRSAFVGGIELEKFEIEFARWIGEGYSSVGVANGTDAIEIAVQALGLKEGDEAIVPAMTFVATIEALLSHGLSVKLVDVESKTGLMNVSQLKSKISSRTKLVVPVHLYGQMAQMDEIRTIADAYGAQVLEDASQAHGARWKGREVGYYSHVATFSFYPGKNLGAFGDGGAILSEDKALIRRSRSIANHGGLKKYEHLVPGRNSRLDNIQAAILVEKLKFVDTWNQSRRQIAKWYYEGLKGITSLKFVEQLPESESVFHLFAVRVQERAQLQKFLSENGVETGIHYPRAIHQLPSMQSLFAKEQFPEAELLASEVLSLPMCPTLILDEVLTVIKLVRSYYQVS